VKARLFRSLLMLYPKNWRERYSEEVADLSAELLAAGEVSQSRLALELTKSALAERARVWHRTRTLAVLLGSAALIVVVAALLATNTFGLGGSTSPRVTWTSPRVISVGLDSIGYRDAQLSFPPSFEAITQTPGGFTGMLSTGSASGGTCVGPFRDTVVCLLPLHQVPSAYAGEQPTILNGVTVYRDAKGDYYAPSLQVEVTASGPMAHRIVDTLTRNRICTHAIWCGSITVTAVG
jgi:hypothetical protein